MQIVTDSGVDLGLTPEERQALKISVVPLVVTLDGQSYREGVDLTADDFYRRLEAAASLPITSQPSPGDIADTYRRLADSDPSILSMHMSSGLSGTYNSARAAAETIPGASITLVDTKTLSAAAGWQVVAAARALRAGWPLDRVLALVRRIQEQTHSLFTLKELKYLIHGGRISHMKGLIASALDLKPLIGVENERGTYVQMGQARAFGGALRGLAELPAKWVPKGSAVRAQVVEASNPEGAEQLREIVSQLFDCSWLPMGKLSMVLGAHTGPTMVGLAFAPLSVFADVP